METDPIDIPDTWALTPADLALVMAKNEANRVDFALLLLFYRAHGRFPNEPEEIEPGAVANIARQLGTEGVANNGFNTADRTWKRHRAEIRALAASLRRVAQHLERLSERMPLRCRHQMRSIRYLGSSRQAA